MIDHLTGVVVGTAQDANRRTNRRTLWLALTAAVLAGLLRLPFLFTGLSSDEGGYAYVAQQWSRGARLYDAAWVDRPQGLLLVYRVLLWIDESGWTIRLGVVLAGVIITLALGVIGSVLVCRRAGIVAAFSYAVAGVAPHLEGMTLNGELLASAPATIAVACAVFWWRRSPSLWWLLAAGLFAGLAVTMKQSGIDGIVAGLVVVSLSSRSRLRNFTIFLGGVAVPVVACVFHGVSVGWSRYWTALAGYQLSALGGPGSNASTRWSQLVEYAPQVAWDLAPIVVVSLLGWRFLDRGARQTAAAWLFACFVGINLGGSYWPHYYVQPLPPLVVVAGAAVVGAASVRWRVALVSVVLLPTLVWLIALIPMSPSRRAEAIPFDAVAARNDRIAAVIEASTAPSDRIYVLESEAYLYFATQRVSPYPYLWGMPIKKIPDAIPRMRAMLASPQRPTLVILDTPNPNSVDPSGRVAKELAKHYFLDSTVEGVQIMRANSSRRSVARSIESASSEDAAHR